MPHFGVYHVGFRGWTCSAKLRQQAPRYGGWSWQYHAAAHVSGGTVVAVHSGSERYKLRSDLGDRKITTYLIT